MAYLYDVSDWDRSGASVVLKGNHMTLKVHNLPPAPAPTRDCRPRSVPVSAPHNFADAQKGVSRPRWRSGEWTSEEDAELRRLASLGMSCNCIGRKMNRQPGSVYQRMKKLKIETAQKRFDHQKAYAEINKSESWRMKNTEG